MIDIYCPKKTDSSGIAVWEKFEDLNSLATGRAFNVAAKLKNLLEEINFDTYNQYLRNPEIGGDYNISPFPRDDVVISKEDIMANLKREAYENSATKPHIKRILHAFRFFVYGEKINQIEALELLGENSEYLLNELEEVGLIKRVENINYILNDLSLVSRRLKNGKIIYLFADTPSYIKQQKAFSGRVYVGTDSLHLLNYIQENQDFSGIGIDFGSGSGIQTFVILKTNPDVKKMFMYEFDKRAQNLSLFNASMNGVRNQVEIVQNKEELRDRLSALNLKTCSFAISNPPYNPIPEFIEIPAKLNLNESEAINILGEIIRLDLKKLYLKAGWGGTDGLTIIKNFLDLSAEFIEINGTVLIYSPVWAGNEQGPLIIKNYIVQKSWSLDFQKQDPVSFPLKNDPHYVDHPLVTAEDMAHIVATKTIDINPFLHEKKDLLKPILIEKIITQYKKYGISYFYGGFSIIKIGQSGSTSQALDRSECPLFFSADMFALDSEEEYFS